MRLRKSAKFVLAERYGWICHYCHKKLSPPPEKVYETVYTTLENNKQGWFKIARRVIPDDFVQATLDHMVPKSKGGDGGISNLVLSCIECNNEKSDKYTYEQFMKRKREVREKNESS